MPSVQANTPETTIVRALPTREVEPYITRDQLAQLMCVSVDTIDRMVKAGMPSETWGRRTRRFLASRAVAWAREQHREAA